jgi:hypothetical protein
MDPVETVISRTVNGIGMALNLANRFAAVCDGTVGRNPEKFSAEEPGSEQAQSAGRVKLALPPMQIESLGRIYIVPSPIVYDGRYLSLFVVTIWRRLRNSLTSALGCDLPVA